MIRAPLQRDHRVAVGTVAAATMVLVAVGVTGAAAESTTTGEPTTGPAAPVIYRGAVDRDGTLLAGNVGAQRSGPGSYRVRLGRSPVSCAVAVTPGASRGGGARALTAFVISQAGSSTVTVRFHDPASGTNTDTGFSITVIC